MFPRGLAARRSPSGHATSGDGEHDEYGEHEDNEAPGLRLTVRATHRGQDSPWLPRVDGLKSDGWQRMAQTESRFRAHEAAGSAPGQRTGRGGPFGPKPGRCSLPNVLRPGPNPRLTWPGAWVLRNSPLGGHQAVRNRLAQRGNPPPAGRQWRLGGGDKIMFRGKSSGSSYPGEITNGSSQTQVLACCSAVAAGSAEWSASGRVSA